MNFGDVRWAFDKRLPELETAGDPAPTAAAPAFEAAIAEVPSINILPLPHDFRHLASPLSPFPTGMDWPHYYHHAGRLRQGDSEAVECYAQHAQYDRATGLCLHYRVENR